MLKYIKNILTTDYRLEQIKDYLRVLDSAMERHDQIKLAQIIDPDAKLTHTTGYTQDNQDWISQIGNSYFNYKYVNSSNITYIQEGNIFTVSYNWTIVNSKKWKFHNILKLEQRKEGLVWIEANRLSHR